MRSTLKITMMAILPLMIGGCQTVDGTKNEETQKADITPAVLTQKSAAAHQEIEATISKAMGGQKVSLATEVLMVESSVSVQQKQVMGPDSNPLVGRIMTKPDTFTLHTDGTTCTLTHQQSGKVYPLPNVVCERAPK